MLEWTVYCHTHVESERRYVGVTSQTVEKRWKNHVHAAFSSKDGRWHFPNAIRKYGKDAFSHEVLGVFDNLEAANDFEKSEIIRLDTRNPEKGFNLAEGGKHVPHPKKNPWDRPEFREKMLPVLASLVTAGKTPLARAAHRAALDGPEWKARHAAASMGRTHGPEARAKISAAKVGKSPSPETRAKLSARIVSPETRAKISGSSRGRAKSQETLNKLSISNKLTKSTPEGQAVASIASKELWSRPEFRERMLASHSIYRKGRKLSPETRAKIVTALKCRPRKTHCKSGHSLDDAYIKATGVRVCRTCDKLRKARAV